MKSPKIDFSIDLLICMAIKDLSAQEQISEAEARNRLLASRAVQLVYDPSNQLWTEGPDALLELYREIG